MYQIFFDNYPIYDPRDEALAVRDPAVHLAVGEAGEMSFTIDPDHPYVSRISRLKGVMELRADGVPIFKGRVVNDKRDFYLSRQIEVEGLLACLNDSMVAPFDFPGDWADDAAYKTAAASGNVVEFFLAWLLNQHNAQVSSSQRVSLGTVTVSDPNNYISRSSTDYVNTLETIRGKLVDLLGGYLLIDYSGDVPVLNYYSDLPLVNTQVVEYGENLLDLVQETDATEVYTAMLPVGKDGLTLDVLDEDLEEDDGEISPGYYRQGKIVVDSEAEALYGCRIVRTMDWPDVTDPLNLQTRAWIELSNNGAKLAQTITVKAVDLGSVTPEAALDLAVADVAVADRAVADVSTSDPIGVSRFVVGRYVELQSSPHGFSALYPLMELDPDILNPGNTAITFGATYKSASGMARISNMAAQEQLAVQRMAIDQTQEAISQMHAAQVAVAADLEAQAAELEELPTIVQQQVTGAIQTAESIVFSALERYVETSNFEEYRQTVESQFELLADELVLRFTEATDQTRVVDGDLQRTLETLAKYFEFGLDGLTIRAGENAMELSLDNDLVIFRRNGQQFGWWDGVDFHTGNIVIGVEERAQFGSFAFVPRENGISFLEVGN